MVRLADTFHFIVTSLLLFLFINNFEHLEKSVLHAVKQKALQNEDTSINRCDLATD